MRSRLMNSVTGVSYESFYPIGSIAAILGNPNAYVGFTAATQSNTMTDQYFSNFRFTVIPEPATLSLLGLAALATLRPRRG